MDTQRPYYTHIGCDLLDVRCNSEMMVARAVIRALRQGKIVVGVVDRISDAPPEDAAVNKSATLSGQLLLASLWGS